MSLAEVDNPELKQQVHDYWNANPCGTQFTELTLGSKEFFAEVERFRYETQPFMREAMEFDKHRGKSLLEIGCGLATDLLQFARGGAIVTGVDLTEQSIALATERFRQQGIPLTARVADAERLPFADGSFDVVYSFGVLHHTPDTRKALHEAERVLKPGGQLLMMLYHRSSVHVWLGTLLYPLLKRWAKREASSADDWIRVYDGAENPLGKAYTRSEVKTMLPSVRSLSFETRDPLRRHWPVFFNRINQILFARRFGFYLIIKGIK